MELEKKPTNFIKKIVEEDLKSGKHSSIVTRFPPEPSGYLHIGHAKAICTDFGIAEEYSGKCNLRFDDTNPSKESEEYVNSIEDDIKWLGFDWEDRKFYASNYFDKLYEFAEILINKGKAFVCELTAEEVREYRGDISTPGKNSPYRERSIEENLDLFRRMKAGEFKDGEKTLRAKIDMSSPNFLMRDPAIYRIKRVHHHNTGDKWCIYPMYDFAHCLSDAIEGITHSICTLEFQDNRRLYDWFVEEVGTPAVPKQYEFSRLNLSHTITSKRKLLKLVEGNYVDGWDDPRMPTLRGLRRRGVSPSSIKTFMEKIGISKVDSNIHITQFEWFVREELKDEAPRVMAVLNPVKVVIENLEEPIEMEMKYHPKRPELGTRIVRLTKEIYIDREDFREEADDNFFRLAPGKEVRLKQAYNIICKSYDKDENGEITTIYCEYDPDSSTGKSKSGKKVKGILHWLSCEGAIDAEVRLYSNLFSSENPAAEDNFLDHLAENSLTIIKGAKLESSMVNLKPESRFQFERVGYFVLDRYSEEGNYSFNRVVTLR